MGAHTAGLGYPPGFNSDEEYIPKSYMLDTNSFCYKQVNDNHHDVCDTLSHNKLSIKILESHDHIKKNNFYEKFLPKDFLR